MRLQEILLGGAILLIALGIIILNDKLKKTDSKSKTKPKTSKWGWGLLVSIACLSMIIAITYMYGQKSPSLIWIILVFTTAFVLLVVLFITRKSILLLTKSMLTGIPVAVIRMTADGNMQMKCPNCSVIIQVTVGHKGDSTFQCENCGEKGTLHTEPNS